MTQKLGRADIHYDLLKAQSINQSAAGSSAGSGGAPGGASGDVQYNNGSGGFAGVSSFHWDNGALVLSIGGDVTLLTGANRTISVSNPVSGNGNSLTLRAASGTGAGNGGHLYLEPGKASSGDAFTGNVIFNPDFVIGQLSIVVANNTTTNGSGVSTHWQGSSGNGSGNGGAFVFVAGSASQVSGTGAGGNVEFYSGLGGSTSGSGGALKFQAGLAVSGNGGDVTFIPGSTSGGGTRGYFKITRDTSGGQPIATLSLDSMTGDHTYTLRDATGTLALTSDIPSVPTGANPTVTIGLTAVNGSAATFLRSDGAPALSQAIAPTWTGKHIWTPTTNATPSAIFTDHSGATILAVDSVNGRVGIDMYTPSDQIEIFGNVTNGGGVTISGAGSSKVRIGTLATTIHDWFGFFANLKFIEASGNWNMDDPSIYGAFYKIDCRTTTYGDEISFYSLAPGSNPRPDSDFRVMMKSKMATGQMLIGLVPFSTNPVAQLDILPNSTTTKGLIIKGVSSYAENYLELQNSSSVVGLKVDNDFVLTDSTPSATAGVLNRIIIDRTGTPANNDGSAILWQGTDSTTAAQAMARDRVLWVDKTHASRKSRRILSVYDTAERDAITIEASGSAAMIGFLGHTAQALPAAYTVTGSATRTMATDPSSAFTGIDNAQVGTVYAQLSDLNTLRTAVSTEIGVMKQLLADLAGYGLTQ